MGKKEYWILVILLFVSITTLGYLENKLTGAIRSLCLGIVGFALGRFLSDER